VTSSSFSFPMSARMLPLVNSDPYGDGWICVIDLADGADVEMLMDAAAYRALTEA
jgi:glycine cleavage system H lipoate-binding protein